MAIVALSASPATLDSGGSEFVSVTNTGAVDVTVSRGSQSFTLRPNQSRTVYPEGTAVTAVSSGTGQVTTLAQAAQVTQSQQVAANTAAIAALPNTYASLGLAGKQTYDTTDALALRAFRIALAARNTAACDILHLGDSITWGLKSTTQAKRWTSVFRDTLRTRFPNTTPVAGGFGFMPSIQTFGGTTPADATVVRTGGSTASSGFGLDQNAVVLSAAGNLTFTFTGTGMDIFYAQFGGGGTFSYTVDGGSATNVVTNGATAYGSRNQAIRGLTAGSHTVVVAWVSGSVYLTGGFAYNGDEAAGIRSWNAAWPSTQSTYWWDVAHNYWLESIANVAPKLVTIELGPNDYAGASPVAVATYTTNVQSIISAIKTKAGTSPSFVLIPTWPLTPSGTPLAAWSAYVTAMYSIAAADPNNVCVDDWMLRTSSTAGTTIGGLLDADNTHPNPTGDRYLGEHLAQFVSPR